VEKKGISFLREEKRGAGKRQIGESHVGEKRGEGETLASRGREISESGQFPQKKQRA